MCTYTDMDNRYLFRVNSYQLNINSVIITLAFVKWALINESVFPFFNDFFNVTVPFVNATSSCANLLVSQTNTSGVIQSNNMSTTYKNNMDCQWNISSNARVELVFFRLHTQRSADNVSVYDGGSLSSPLIGTFSGSSLPAPITSSSSKLYARFTSDSSTTYGGFRAHYRGKICVTTHTAVKRKNPTPLSVFAASNFVRV